MKTLKPHTGNYSVYFLDENSELVTGYTVAQKFIGRLPVLKKTLELIIEELQNDPTKLERIQHTVVFQDLPLTISQNSEMKIDHCSYQNAWNCSYCPFKEKDCIV